MDQLLAALRRLDVSGSKLVDAGVFQTEMEKLGMPLGSKGADEIVARCSVQSDGRIDFSGIESPIVVARQQGQQIQTGENANLPPFVLSDDKKENVKLLRPQLQEIFTRYDAGQLSTQGVKEDVHKLGLEETAAFEALIRSAPLDMTFSQLYQSLLQVNESPRAPAVKNMPTSRFGSRNESLRGKSTNVISWDPAPPSKPQLLSPKGLESRESPWNPVGDESDVHFHNSRRKMVGSQAAIQSHIVFQQGTPEVKRKPAKDVEDLKNEIYACVRELDQGSVDTSQFERKMKQLDVKLPDEVLRLLDKAKADGTIHFAEFAFAFESLFRSVEEKEAAQPPVAPIQIAKAPPQTFRIGEDLGTPSGQKKASPEVTSRAQTTHGDLIAWSQTPSQLEEQANASFKKGKSSGTQHLDAHQKNQIDLSWDEESAPAEPKQSRLHPNDLHHKPTNSLISWDIVEEEEK